MHCNRYWQLVIYILILFGTEHLLSETVSTIEKCVIEKIASASDNVTLGELRSACKNLQIKTVKILPRAEIESTIKPLRKRKQRLSFSPHKANYIFPISYNSTPNSEPYVRGLSVENIHNFEIVFQLSSKMRLIEDLFGDNGDLYGAYTGRFWWQAYNNDLSSPFRETNHEPELFLDFDTDIHFGEWDLTHVVYGMVHQSNGRSLPLSRSWNRIYMEMKFRDKQAWINVKPWFHVPESEKENLDDPEGDDNPDIDRYMGYLELKVGYDFGKNHLSTMLRNNLRSDNRGAFQVDWTFPIWENTDVRGYVQYFSGYGESLIDYNAQTNRLSIGFIMSESNE